jgi:uncharacterized protein DUF4124
VLFRDCTVRFAGRVAIAAAGALSACVVYPASADQVYKSVDAQGHVTYSDRPTTTGARKTDIAVQQADPKEAERLAKERVLLRADDEQRIRKENDLNRVKAQQDGEKKQRCAVARSHYNSLMSASRLYEPAANGNREYYTDAQADAMRAAAKRAMDDACGT